MVTIRREREADVALREALLDVSYGPVRFSKTSERLREGRLPDLSFVATSGRRLVGTVRLWDVSAGRAGRRCCSGRSRWRPTAASAASARRSCRSRCVKRPSRPWRRAAGRRRALLRTVRLLEREDRSAVAARALRAAPAARLRARAGRARRRARADQRRRSARATARPRHPRRELRPQRGDARAARSVIPSPLLQEPLR